MTQIRIRIFLFIIFVFSNITFSQTQSDSLQLNDIIKLTIEKYPSVKQAESLIEASDARIKIGKSSYYPIVDGNLSYVRIGPIAKINFGGQAEGLFPADNYNFNVNLRQLVYDFGQRDSQIKLYESYKTSAIDNLEFTKSQLVYTATNIFYTILYLKESIKVKDEQLKALNDHLDITKKKVQSGSATDFDISSTNVRISLTQNQKVDIENQLHKQEILLKQLIGLSPDEPLNISGKFETMEINTDFDSLLVLAYKQRPEMKLANDSKEIAERNIKIAEMSDNPTLNVELQYGLKNGLMPNLDVLRGNWIAAAGLNVPIFNGFFTKNKVDEAKANYKAADIHTSDVQLSVRSEIEKALSDLETSRKQIDITSVQVEHAKQTVARSELQYQSGVITNLDLLDSETSLTEAHLLHLQAIYNTIISIYELRKSIGDIIY